MHELTSRKRRQFGALPFRILADGRVRVLLVTSKGGRRWVIPKGSAISGLGPAEVAAREAFEEAGLVGAMIGERPVGSFRYAKRDRKKGQFTVAVYLMAVERELEVWPECRARRTGWFDPAMAARLVEAEELAALLREVARDFRSVLESAGSDAALPSPHVLPYGAESVRIQS